MDFTHSLCRRVDGYSCGNFYSFSDARSSAESKDGIMGLGGLRRWRKYEKVLLEHMCMNQLDKCRSTAQQH